jgi:hypothetical protein
MALEHLPIWFSVLTNIDGQPITAFALYSSPLVTKLYGVYMHSHIDINSILCPSLCMGTVCALSTQKEFINNFKQTHTV